MVTGCEKTEPERDLISKGKWRHGKPMLPLGGVEKKPLDQGKKVGAERHRYGVLGRGAFEFGKATLLPPPWRGPLKKRYGVRG